MASRGKKISGARNKTLLNGKRNTMYPNEWRHPLIAPLYLICKLRVVDSNTYYDVGYEILDKFGDIYPILK